MWERISSGFFLPTERQDICWRWLKKMFLSGRVPKEEPEELLEFLSGEDRPTAVLVSDDILAMALVKTALELHLHIPEDLSVISFNNSLFSKLSSPQLTSIDINSRQLGIEAASQMINHIENPGLLATKIIVPHFMIRRESCAPPKERI